MAEEDNQGKHKKYKSKYGEKEVFWGLGIEEETYFQFSKPFYVAAPILRTAQKSERYSVSYYTSYTPETLSKIGNLFTDSSGFYPLPFFFNGHAFTRMDSSGRHELTYEKRPKLNVKFSGKTFFKELQDYYPSFFVKEYEKSFTFDGDTVEFITQDFYKAKASKVIKELLSHKTRFLKEMNTYCKKKKLFQQYGSFIFPPVNPGFAVFYTNPSNIAIFNNGTYHINITLPTLLGAKDASGLPTIIDPILFKQQHKNCIRMFQWLEPFLIALYGTADPFPGGSRASQRCAMSRYIGIGTYDTDAMPEGKILTQPIDKIRGSLEPFWWYKVYHENSGYVPLTNIGMDINYKKHYLHGIEIRIFDWFPEKYLRNIIKLLVYVAEASLLHKEVLEPAISGVWNDIVVRVLREGKICQLDAKDMAVYEHLFNITLLKQKGNLTTVYEAIFKALEKKYGKGKLARAFF